MNDNLLIISGDGHVALPMKEYRPYLEERYHPAFDELLADASAKTTINFFDILDPELAKRHKATIYDSGAIEGHSDPERRVQELAKDGIVGELLFPDGTPFSAGGLGSARTRFPGELEQAGARAYNRWIADFTSGHPALGAQAILCLHDVSEAVKDVYRAKELGFKSLFMPGMDDGRPLLWDPCYEPLWSAAEEVGLPLNFHGGTGLPDYGGAVIPGVPGEVRARISGFEFPWWAHRPLWFLIWSGVLENHPNLRIAFTEQHSDWVIHVLAMMDHSWHNSMMNDSLKKIVKRPPSEYYQRQVWVGSSLLSRGELLTRDRIGTDKMMFGADFPHPEGTFGVTREYLRATIGATDMTDDEIRAFLGGNAAAFYGFDVDVLRPMADSHGLTLEEIRVPLPQGEEEILRRVDALRPTMTLTDLR